MSKSTYEIEKEIKECKNLEKYLESNKEEFQEDAFSRTMKNHFSKSGQTQDRVAEKAMLSASYVNNILNKSEKPKKPSRDTIIKIAFGLELTLDDANRLLHLAGYGKLYAKYERESIIMFGLNNGASLIDVNILLDKRGEAVLAGK